MDIGKILSSFNHKSVISHSETEAMINSLEGKYQASFLPEVKQILQIGTVGFLQVGKRKIRFMGLSEIGNADEFLHVPFIQKHLIPLFDLMDNDFICYNLKANNYCIFNIIDESEFLVSSKLEALLGKL